MTQPNLTLTFNFKDDTPEVSLELNDNYFNFEYGVREGKTNSLGAIINIHSNNGIAIAQNFLFSHYQSILNTNNIKQITIDIFRPDRPDSTEKFVFQENTFNDFSFIYMNDANGDSMFVISFNFTPPEK